MLRTSIAIALMLGLVGLSSTPAFSQPASTDADRTVRQGDTIEWISFSGPPHRVRFGGNVGGTTLTSVSDTQGLLENFTPALTISGDKAESGNGSGGALLLTAKVKANAAVGTTFIFTCGIHTTPMISQKFTIAASDPGQQPRTHRIKGIAGLHWVLEVVKVEDAHADTTP